MVPRCTRISDNGSLGTSPAAHPPGKRTAKLAAWEGETGKGGGNDRRISRASERLMVCDVDNRASGLFA